MEGGGKQGQAIHDSIKERLETEFGYSKEEAKAVKSILYDKAKGKVSDDTPGRNLLRAKEMEKMLTKKELDKITSKELKARLELIASQKKQSGARSSSKKASKKASKKGSRKPARKSSKKASRKSARKSSKKASRK